MSCNISDKAKLFKTSVHSSGFQKVGLILFGICLTAIILEAGLRLGGGVLLSIQEYRNRVSISQRGTYRILCLGESTTAGQYPYFLEEILNQRNPGIKFSVIDKGVSGATTNTILSHLESNLDTYHPDMVITMMGINDDAPHMPDEKISNSKTINFLKSFRMYKLVRFLWLHIVTKLNDFNQPKVICQRDKSLRGDAKNKNISPGEMSFNYKKDKMLNSKNYIESGDFYQNQGRFFKAEEQYKKAIALDPRSDQAYVGLGNSYRNQGKFSEAEEHYKKAIALSPRNDHAYIELGNSYRNQGSFSEAEKSYKKAIELNPQGIWAYSVLGSAYQHQGRLSEAEKLYRKVIELAPKNDWAYLQLGSSYQGQGRFSEAEEKYKEVIKLNPKNDRVYGGLEVLYTEMGKLELAREYGKKARELRLSYYDLRPNSIANYHKLKAILDKRDITYVCTQYPMRNLEPLKEIFRDDSENIIYVDNEKVFKEALKTTPSQEYFRDMFAGDFGHCTDKGNRLLAENIAKVILKKCKTKVRRE